MLTSLSQKFRDTFGEEVTSEWVALLNVMDDSHKQEFREQVAANFGQARTEMDHAVRAADHSLGHRPVAGQHSGDGGRYRGPEADGVALGLPELKPVGDDPGCNPAATGSVSDG